MTLRMHHTLRTHTVQYKTDLQHVLYSIACLVTGLGRRTAGTIHSLVWQDLLPAHGVQAPEARNCLLCHVRASRLVERGSRLSLACTDRQISRRLSAAGWQGTRHTPATEHATHEQERGSAPNTTPPPQCLHPRAAMRPNACMCCSAVTCRHWLCSRALAQQQCGERGP